MKFNITNVSGKEISANINIIKDFGFAGYYPMISERSWDKIKGNENQYTVYVENLYDKLINDDLYENDGEKLIVYIYTINENEFKISDVTYAENLLTKKNNYNIEVIPANNNGVIILNVNNINGHYYSFGLCKGEEIKFNIYSSNGNFSENTNKKEYPFTEVINENKQIIFEKYYNNEKEILIHTFESSSEFFFSYTFGQYVFNPFSIYSILSAFKLQTNILQIKFETVSSDLENYYILVAKKDDLNNIESFSNMCYISKLFINNDFNSILVKNVYKKSNDINNYVIENIDITELNYDNNAELVVTIVSYLIQDFFKFYQPIKVDTNIIIKEIQFGDEIYFNLETNYTFSFEYNHKFKDRKQKLSFIFKQIHDNTLYLILNNEFISNYDRSLIRTDFMLTDSGKYYLEIYKSQYPQYNIKEGYFIPVLADTLIDIINLRKKEYRNDKIVELPFGVEPNYYIVKNLVKDENVEFTFDAKYTTKEKPFVVCNNNTNECYENVDSFTFVKGNEYTIFIKYLYLRSSYIYPSFIIHTENEEEYEIEEEENEKEKEIENREEIEEDEGEHEKEKEKEESKEKEADENEKEHEKEGNNEDEKESEGEKEEKEREKEKEKEEIKENEEKNEEKKEDEENEKEKEEDENEKEHEKEGEKESEKEHKKEGEKEGEKESEKEGEKDETKEEKEEEKENEKNGKEENGLSTAALVGIIVGSSLAFIILIFVIFLIIRYVRKKNQDIDFEKESEDISKEFLLKSQ